MEMARAENRAGCDVRRRRIAPRPCRHVPARRSPGAALSGHCPGSGPDRARIGRAKLVALESRPPDRRPGSHSLSGHSRTNDRATALFHRLVYRTSAQHPGQHGRGLHDRAHACPQAADGSLSPGIGRFSHRSGETRLMRTPYHPNDNRCGILFAPVYTAQGPVPVAAHDPARLTPHPGHRSASGQRPAGPWRPHLQAAGVDRAWS